MCGGEGLVRAQGTWRGGLARAQGSGLGTWDSGLGTQRGPVCADSGLRAQDTEGDLCVQMSKDPEGR